ncbi:threonylcarbamoyl-AMP synthase [bacterium]|nr:threonylcarbamoyl-AMP synthase [bacterium]MBU1652790.1 threonylcarbamoyl-AMP synthase [bacterium]
MEVLQHSENLDLVSDVLRHGGIIVYPTETVYGFGCLADQPKAIDRIAELKGSPEESHFLVLIGKRKEIASFCVDVPSLAFPLMDAFWPGPLTLILPAAHDVHPRLIGPSGGVAIRLSSHPWPGSLLQKVKGGLISTSANLHGQPVIRNRSELGPRLLRSVDLFIDWGDLDGGVSTMIDLCEDPPKCVREGTIKLSEIENVIGPIVPANNTVR